MKNLRSLLAILATCAITVFTGGLLVLLFWLPRRAGLFEWCATLWSSVILRSIGVTYTSSGRELLEPGPPAVYMANHQSLLDTPLLFHGVSPRLRFVAKSSLRWIPFMGWAMAVNDFIFIDRQDRASAIGSLERAARKIGSGVPVLMFPEGTRGDGNELLPFKKGGFLLAIDAQVPIIPIRITGTGQLLSRDGLLPRPGQVHLALGAPISTRGLTPADRDQLMAQVQAALQALPTG